MHVEALLVVVVRPGASFAGVRVCSRKLHATGPPSLIQRVSALRAIEDYDGLAPLVFVRPGELRKAEWAEFDLEHAEWRIPGSQNENGSPAPSSPLKAGARDHL